MSIREQLIDSLALEESMTTAISKVEPSIVRIPEQGFSRDKIDLIKRTIAVGASDDELELFLYTAKKTGLDPLARQIYAIKRGGKMTIQTGIDGYRLIADRTRQLAGISDYAFDNEDGQRPNRASVTVKKIVDGNIAEFTATARWSEYAQDQSPMWKKMPYLMLGKCAEALALRKAFPADLSGVYTQEEMMQADTAAQAIPQGALTLDEHADYLESIETASDINALQLAFTSAYKAATTANDRAALKQFIDAKDARKKAINASN